jgi:2-succinyl-6-hydroxy-2,4-cyclohexadiene-1-carboxylate synthase
MTTVLFLHGFLGAPSTFERVRERLGRIDTVAPVLPGHGRPPRTDLPSAFDAVVDALATGLPERSVVVGYSMGARLGLALALRQPARVAGAVLIGVNPGLSGDALAARAAWDETQARAVEAHGLEAFVDAWEQLPLFASQRRLAPELRREERLRRTSHTPEGIALALRSLGLSRQGDLTAAVAGVRVPLVLLAGSLDTKFRAVHESLALRSPLVDARVVEGGHNLALEAPAAVARATLTLLETVDEKGMNP